MDAPHRWRQTAGMPSLNFAGRLPAIQPLPRWLLECGCGFLYWLAFLLVLEPDNALRASEAGHALAIGREALRMVVAATLGASTTPLLLSLARRFPLHGKASWRHAMLHVAGAAGLAIALVIASCFLAAWGFHGDWLPKLADLREALIGNALLLAFALLALDAIAYLVGPRTDGSSNSSSNNPAAAITSGHATRVPVKTRGRQGFVDLAEVDWIETQGNYLALHTGDRMYLIRESSVAFEARLDPARFLRVHRRAIVAIDRIRELQPLTNGDALLRLSSGQELRASRRYRKLVAERWGNRGAG
jgi:hypothetical protein